MILPLRQGAGTSPDGTVGAGSSKHAGARQLAEGAGAQALAPSVRNASTQSRRNAIVTQGFGIQMATTSESSPVSSCPLRSARNRNAHRR